MGLIPADVNKKEVLDQFKAKLNEEIQKNGDAAFRAPRRDSAFYELSEEEQREVEQLDCTRRAVQQGIYSTFEGLLRIAPNPLLLLCLPEQLARNESIGTNTVMRMFVSNDASHERFLVIEDICRDLPVQAYLPTRRQLAHRLTQDSNHEYTIAECYWLWQFCQFLGGASAFFTTSMTRVLNTGKPEEFDFRVKLDPANNEHQLLLVAAREQYDTLVHLLKVL